MYPTPTAGPGKAGYVIGALLLVVGVIGGTLLFIGGVVSSVDRVNDYERVPAATGGTVRFGSTGSYNAYFERPGVQDRGDIPPGLQVQMRAPDGTAQVLSADRFGGASEEQYSFGEHEGVRFARFRVEVEGRYDVQVLGEPASASSATIAFGETAFEGLAIGAVVGFLGGGLLALVGVILLIVTGVRRNSYRKRNPYGVAGYGRYGSPGYGGPGYGPPGSGYGGPATGPPPGWAPPAPAPPPPPPSSPGGWSPPPSGQAGWSSPPPGPGGWSGGPPPATPVGPVPSTPVGSPLPPPPSDAPSDPTTPFGSPEPIPPGVPPPPPPPSGSQGGSPLPPPPPSGLPDGSPLPSPPSGAPQDPTTAMTLERGDQSGAERPERNPDPPSPAGPA